MTSSGLHAWTKTGKLKCVVFGWNSIGDGFRVLVGTQKYFEVSNVQLVRRRFEETGWGKKRP